METPNKRNKKRIEKFYLLGHRISYSLSPLIYNKLFHQANIPAVYELLDTPPENLEEKITFLRRTARGFNITIPYKRVVHGIIDYYGDDAAREIGGVNTVLVGDDGGLVGYNTDWLGFAEILLEKMNNKGEILEEAVLVGYGGAARAALYALARLGFKRVHIMGRSPGKARELLGEARGWRDSWKLTSGSLRDSLPGDLGVGYLLVNATPMGSCSVPWLVDPCGLASGAGIVYDIVYYPVETLLVECGLSLGVGLASGLEMLAGQASYNLGLWLGLNVDWRLLYRFALEGAVWSCGFRES